MLRRLKLTFLTILIVMLMGTIGCQRKDSEELSEGMETLSENQRREPVTLKFLLFGDEPKDFHLVLDEFHNRVKDTLNIQLDVEWLNKNDYKDTILMKMLAKENYDLVFDAYFLRLKELSEKGTYADLDYYFNNPEYEGLMNSFSESLIDNNRIDGAVYAIPILRTYSNGIPSVHYRQDLADKYGIGAIDSIEKLQQYLDCILVNEKEMVPLALKDTRGFHSLNPIHAQTPNTDDYNIRIMGSGVSGIGFAVEFNEDFSQIKAIAAEGDMDERWSGFSEGFQFDYPAVKLNGYYQWRKYCEPDSINQKNPEALFMSGKAAAHIGTLDDYENIAVGLSSNVPKAQLGEYIISSSHRDMKERAIRTDYSANNYICIPAYSKKKDETMSFLNWLFSNRDNHDLFELGIEGVHWNAIGENQYEIVNGMEDAYLFPGYSLTWNPNYVRFAESMPDKILEYKKYELMESTFRRDIMSDFTFNTENLKSEIARVRQIKEEIHLPLHHGLLEDPIQKLEANVIKCRENGFNAIQEEFVKQLNEFLKSMNK